VPNERILIYRAFLLILTPGSGNMNACTCVVGN